MLLHPAAARELTHDRLVELALGGIVDVLDASGRHLQFRLPQRPPDASVLAVEPLCVDEQPEALVEGEARDVRLRLLLSPRGHHSFQPHRFELLRRRFCQHAVLLLCNS
jgi:hypothetical protein